VRRATENIFPWCAQGRTWASLDNSETRSYNLCSGGPREIYRCQREIGCKFNWPSHSSRDLWRGLSGVCRQMCTKMLFDRSHSLSLFGIEVIVRNILCQLQLYTCVAIMKWFSIVKWRWAIITGKIPFMMFVLFNRRIANADACIGVNERLSTNGICAQFGSMQREVSIQAKIKSILVQVSIQELNVLLYLLYNMDNTILFTSN
jgi:hypothetical protein